MLADTEDLARLYTPASFTIKWTTLPWEANEAYKLRRAVFCIEQGFLSAMTAMKSMNARNCSWR